MNNESNLQQEINDVEIEEEFPRGQSLYYATGKLGYAFYGGLYGFLTYYYQIKLGLAWGYISLAFMIYAIWNAINDPLFGIISDRTQSEKGRRIPFIRYGTPFLAISFVMLWIPFVSASNQLGLFFYLLLVLLFYDTFYTLVVITLLAMIGELALTSKIRTRINLTANIIAGIGTAVSAILPPIFLYTDEPLQKPLDPFQFFVIALGVISFILLFIASYRLKEKKIFYTEDQPGFIDSIKYTIKNRAFLILELIIFVSVFLQYFILSGVSYYIDYVLDLKGFSSTVPLLGFFLLALLGFLFFNYLGGRIGIRKAFTFSVPFSMSGAIFLFFPHSVYELLIPIALLGFGTSAMLLFIDPMIVDVSDMDELKNGRRREACFFGVNALITKPAQSFAVLALTGLLAVFHFVEPDTSGGAPIPQLQPPEAIFGIRLVMSVVPFIIFCIVLIGIYFYPLDGPEYQEMKLQVKQLHEKKERRLLEELS